MAGFGNGDCGTVGVLGRDDIEPLQGEVEALRVWPAEPGDGGVIVVRMCQQEVSSGPHRVRRGGRLAAGVRHGSYSTPLGYGCVGSVPVCDETRLALAIWGDREGQPHKQGWVR